MGNTTKMLYQIYDAKQPDGKWYKEWPNIPSEFPTPYAFTDQPIPEGLQNPKFIWGTGWVEDDDVLIVSLKKENEDLKERLELVEEFVNKAITE